jgi:hypothetical protein
LRGKPRANGPPAERLLALSNVSAPRLGNTTRSDEVSFFFNGHPFSTDSSSEYSLSVMVLVNI